MDHVLDRRIEWVKYWTKGDWATTVLEDLKELRFTYSLDEIEKMTENMFKNILNKKIKENALEYLVGKQRRKNNQVYKCLNIY